MNRIIYSILVLMCLVSILKQPNAHAQGKYTERKAFRNANAHWFASASPNVMLDLRTFPPTKTLLPTNVSVGESGSGISDTATGDLLFYSSGVNVYNRFHKIMPHGAKIASKKINEYADGSTMQQNSFVPFINDPNKFHFFNLMSVEDTIGGLYYYVVDMRLDSGRGDIDTSVGRKYLYQGPLHEAMVAVPGNNCDVWVLIHPIRDSNFYAYHITAEGLDTVPVISSPGTAAIYDPKSSSIVGTMSVSPLRDKIAISSHQPAFWELAPGNGFMIAAFDPETGKVSNGVIVDKYITTPSHVFSSDGTKLYATGWQLDSFFNITTPGQNLFQYDVSTMTQTAISKSKFNVSPGGFFYMWNGLRARGDTIVTTNMQFIPNSNGAGMLCGFNDTLRYSDIPPGYGFFLGTDAVYPLPATYQNHTKDIKVCYYDAPLQLSATSGYLNYRWSNNAQLNDSVMTISEAGTYWVEYTKFCHTGVDTFHVHFVDFPEPNISVNGTELSTGDEYTTYQWLLNGAIIADATSHKYSVKQNGDYQVIVTGGGCVDTSALYKVTNATNINDFFSQMPVRVYPNPATAVIYIESSIPIAAKIIGIEGKILKKVAHATTIDVRDLPNGMYWIEIRNPDGVLLQVEKFIKSANK